MLQLINVGSLSEVYLSWIDLTHSFPMHPFFTPCKQKTVRFSDVFRGVEKGCIGNEWVKWVMPIFWYFAVYLVWLWIWCCQMWKYYGKSLLKYDKKSFWDNLRYQQINKLYCAILTWTINVSISFKEKEQIFLGFTLEK